MNHFDYNLREFLTLSPFSKYARIGATPSLVYVLCFCTITRRQLHVQS